MATRSVRFILQVTMGIELVLMVAAYFALTRNALLGPQMYLVCLALAMGLQNGALRSVHGLGVHTTFLTGMITTLITGYAGAESSSQRLSEWRVLGGIWAFFVGGALTGAIIVSQLKAIGILGAVLLLLVMVAETASVAGRSSPGT